MKTQKKLIIGSIVGAAVIGSLLVAGCEKNVTEPGSGIQPSTARGGNPTLQTQNSLVSGKAYLAAFDPSGLCTGGPIVHYNAAISYFTASSGASQTTVNDQLCYTTGISWNSVNCTLYFTRGTSTTGDSYLWKVNSDGSVTQLGAIMMNSTTPLYVEEMEFDQNGDMYMLAPGSSGATIALYKIAYANLGNSSNTATFIGNIFSITRSQSYAASLSWRPSSGDLYVTWEVSNNSTNTFYAILSKTTAGLSSTVTCTGTGTVNSADFATYFYNNTLYFARSGSLYTMPASNGSASSAGSGLTMNVKNDMTFFGNCNP